VSAPSRRQAAALQRAQANQATHAWVEHLIQQSAARGIAQIEQHLKEIAR
jgi:hypothetical protein